MTHGIATTVGTTAKGLSSNMQNVVPPQSRRRDEPLPEAREVVPNVWKITVPIPFPLRFVNMHALVGKDGWAIVDTGMGNPDARIAFAAGLQRAGLDIHDLRAIVLTHHHPDHVGLSGELFEQSGAQVYMHPIDAEAIQILWNNSLPQRFGRVSQFFLQHGLPPTQLRYTHVEPQQARTIINVPPPEAVTPVEDGEMLELVGEVYRVIWVPGHSDGQIVFCRASRPMSACTPKKIAPIRSVTILSRLPKLPPCPPAWCYRVMASHSPTWPGVPPRSYSITMSARHNCWQCCANAHSTPTSLLYSSFRIGSKATKRDVWAWPRLSLTLNTCDSPGVLRSSALRKASFCMCLCNLLRKRHHTIMGDIQNRANLPCHSVRGVLYS